VILGFFFVSLTSEAQEAVFRSSAPLNRQGQTVQANPESLQHIHDVEESEDASTGFTLSGIKKAFEDRFGPLSIGFRAIGYYQGANNVTIGRQDITDNRGPGYTLDLMLTWNPIATGTFYMRLHNGYGKGADRHLGKILLANLNTIADDNDEYGNGIQIIEAYYTQSFLNDHLYITIGKTDNETFIDLNAFANDENTQFIGKPFVNSPLLDTRDNYLPTLAIGGSISKELKLVVLAQTMNRPDIFTFEEEGVGQNLFDDPGFSAQLTYSPKLRGFEGNYRLLGGWDSYNFKYPDGQQGRGTTWGMGLSLDQKINEKVGLFARGGCGKKSTFGLTWYWSGGAQLTGILPSRCRDVLGVGISGLVYAQEFQGKSKGMETHMEAYYRIVLNDYFAITPDIQCVISPFGNSGNSTIVAGMLRAEFRL